LGKNILLSVSKKEGPPVGVDPLEKESDMKACSIALRKRSGLERIMKAELESSRSGG